jgi:putative addiction module component (TIGR02574 family)
MWNYRVVRKENKHTDPENKKERVHYTYAIHEAYYDENGYVGAITQDPVMPFGENIEELRHSWVIMAEAFGQPVLDYSNIPDAGYDIKKDPVRSELDKRLKELEAGNEEGIPWEQVKAELEIKWGPFDEEAYQRQETEERLEKERVHSETFVGAPTLEELIRKMCSDYQEYIQRDRAKNPWKYSSEND